MADVPIDGLAQAITQAYREYTDDVVAAIEANAERTANEVLAATEAGSPKNTGKYAKGFKVTKKVMNGSVKYIVWNKKQYRRVHLLEFGHAKRGGGRVRAYPHLIPAYNQKAGNLINTIRQIIKNGG